MTDPSREANAPHWLIKYIIVVETTILLSGITFYFTSFQDVVTKKELSQLVKSPYPPDRGYIFDQINRSIRIDSQFQKDLHDMELELSKTTSKVEYLELRINNMKNGVKLSKKGDWPHRLEIN